MYSMKLFCAVFVFMCIYEGIKGHGRLINPPSRASMWRYGFNTPPDYNDNQGFCGGFSVQHVQNGGKCGICGDAYNAIRKKHETPGRFATGKIVKEYHKGDTIKVEVQITANHRGYFKFKLCANNNVQKDPTQECFDKTTLTSPNGSDKFYIDYSNGIKQFFVALPKDLVCSQCILQWTYITGNSWGYLPDGTGCLGCGSQENFRACSDIAIIDDDDDDKQMPEVKSSTSRSPIASSPSSPSSSTSSPTSLVMSSTPSPSSRRTTKNPTINKIPSNLKCHGAGVFKNNSAYDRWCSLNCANGFCPATHCSCGEDDDQFAECKSHGIFKSGDTDVWCRTNCQLGFCPKSRCICV